MIKKPLPFNNIRQLRELIMKEIDLKKKYESKKDNFVEFIQESITIKPVDYYYTNSIARSSKVMSECKKISKKFLYTGVEKAV